jgi:hypothetical protein
MSEQNEPKIILQLPGSVMEKSDSPSEVQSATEEFRTVSNDAVEFGKVPQTAERNENHTLTVRESARMFEAAGVARTERSIINWCQANRQGIARLDSYFDPNERKYYITPQSVEAAIQEEIQRTKKSTDAPVSEDFGSPVAHVKHPRNSATPSADRRFQELERENSDLKIANQVKDQFINLIKSERASNIEKLQAASRTVGQLETQLLQLQSPRQQRASP